MKWMIYFQGKYVLVLLISFCTELLLTFSKLVPYNKHEVVFFFSILFTLPILIACFFLWQEVKYWDIRSDNKGLVYEGMFAFLVAGFPSVQFLRTFHSDLPGFLVIYGLLQFIFLLLSFSTLIIAHIKGIPVQKEEEPDDYDSV